MATSRGALVSSMAPCAKLMRLGALNTPAPRRSSIALESRLKTPSSCRTACRNWVPAKMGLNPAVPRFARFPDIASCWWMEVSAPDAEIWMP